MSNNNAKSDDEEHALENKPFHNDDYMIETKVKIQKSLSIHKEEKPAPLATK